MQLTIKRLRLWFRRRLQRDKVVESEIQKITDKLIRNSIGSRGKVTQAFQKQRETFNTEKKPIGREEALNMLVNMVKIAVVERNKLEGIIINRVEQGMLNSSYYEEVEIVSDMAAQADSYYRSAETVRDDYLAEYGDYWQNRMEARRNNSKVTLTEQDYEDLKVRIEKINKLTGFGGDSNDPA